MKKKKMFSILPVLNKFIKIVFQKKKKINKNDNNFHLRLLEILLHSNVLYIFFSHAFKIKLHMHIQS